MTLLIKNALIVNMDGMQNADIQISKGRIKHIAKQIKPEKETTEIVDARGMMVFPGGIDSHVHFVLPSHTGPSSDDFRSGSLAALTGGTTTILDFVTPLRNQNLTEALQHRMNEARGCLTDYGFHMSLVSDHKGLQQQIEECINQYGITSYKSYLAYRDTVGIDYQTLEKIMKILAKHKALLMLHCEDGDKISELQKEIAKKPHSPAIKHCLSRPEFTESEAVKMALALALKNHCPLYLVHLSSESSVEVLQSFKSTGKDIYAETCPHYLLLDESLYSGSPSESLKYVLSPPLRNNKCRNALWEAIRNDIIDVLATDHCPFNTKGQKSAGLRNFKKIPGGVGSIEYRMQLLFTYGLLQQTISPMQFAALTSGNAAKIFGLYPQKGAISPGSDADLVIWNPDYETLISKSTQIQHSDNNIFENIPVSGRPEYVVKNGVVIIRNGKTADKIPEGKYLIRNFPPC